MRSCRSLNVDHSMVVWQQKQIGKVKRLGKWVPYEMTANQNIVILKGCLFLFYTMSHFTIRLWYMMKTGFCMTTDDDQLMAGLRRRSKELLKAKLTCKEGHDHCLVVCCGLIHYSFLNPSKTIIFEKYAQQINEMQQKQQCLQPASVNRNGPILLHDNA